MLYRKKSAPATIVSITPVKIEADSRTFKHAASFARFGYTSIVVEKKKSQLDRKNLPFKLLNLEKGTRQKKNIPAQGISKKSNKIEIKKTPLPISLSDGVKIIWCKVKKISNLLPKDLRTILGFLLGYFYFDVLLPLENIPQASLYYLHAPYQFPIVYILSKKYHAPFIYDAHDFYSKIDESRPQSKAIKLIDWFYLLLESFCIKKATAVVTVSQGIANMQRQTFGCQPTVVRNCQDQRLEKVPSQHLRQKLKLSKDAFLLVTIGNAKPGQAIDPAVKAMQVLPSFVHLVFVGKRYETRLKPYLSNLKLKNRVHHLPPVKPYEVVPFIRSANASLILYYPHSVNYKYCLPNGFFQSIAAQLPLVYPELPEIKKIAQHHRLGVAINPQNAQSIKHAIMKLIRHPQKYADYQRNLKTAQKELSWKKEELILKNLLAKVIR